MTLDGLRLAIVGPLPPPAGGMANQTRQLAELLRAEGVAVTVVQVNAPYWPRLVGRLRGIRALFRLMPYLLSLWRAAGRVDLFHIMANSGWSWHLCAAPAIWMARLRGTPTVVNYRGGEAAAFLEESGTVLRWSLRRSNVLVVPSRFLMDVFARNGIASVVVPNIINLERFHPTAATNRPPTTHLVVARNLERIYDIATALRAFALIRAATPSVTLTVAGSGPEREALGKLCTELGIADSVVFCGRLDRDAMADLYRSASVVINPSRIDNMPNSILEAMASGIPVVSTNVGGVPFILREGITGIMIDAGNHVAMAEAVQRILADRQLAARISDAALCEVQQYSWPRVRHQWEAIYASARSCAHGEMRSA
jgi:glycosyltransferase involved in cell wall biosynthesis